MAVQKNNEYLLGEYIPASIRLEVYKEAVNVIDRFIKNNTNGNQDYKEYGLHTPSLCLIIPCILWGLSNYLDDGPDGSIWSYYKTIISFPEIADGVKSVTRYANSNYHKRHLIGLKKYSINVNNLRLEVINKVIKNKSWQKK